MSKKLYKPLLLGALLSIVSFGVFSSSSYQSQVTRDNYTQTRVIVNMWLGEYPGPIINVHADKPGKITVEGYNSLEDLRDPVACTINHGIYHPWSQTKTHSDAKFYTMMPRNSFRAIADGKLENIHVPKGAIIDNMHGLGEGFCLAQMIVGDDIKEIEFICADIESKSFKQLSSMRDDDFWEQWLDISCEEGYKAFVLDDTLLKAPGVKEGQIIEYGKVGP